ncbi:hypothetical protein NADFUDRAFT_53394 [Nadsonia fulvescens var. elongata DSM 6958]|uniref:Uncharacterized protein n=1 Tax=Nadsonia fulvescens var. elongata DSM 6958 TaxID=857566 RepID=A0A1E3PEK2_9ASCO|nr:hypothetical protein NADFUDRAFT_53394 [Nadsonia fulvescens var. elongata DSM 6958]
MAFSKEIVSSDTPARLFSFFSLILTPHMRTRFVEAFLDFQEDTLNRTNSKNQSDTKISFKNVHQ